MLVCVGTKDRMQLLCSFYEGWAIVMNAFIAASVVFVVAALGLKLGSWQGP
jgi:hypothetical protein